MYAFPDGYNFHTLPAVNSTNLYAMQQIHAGMAVDGDVFITPYQQDGKGQRGKNWHASPGDSILMSLIWDCSMLSPSQSFRLSAAVALAVHDFLGGIVVKENLKIKWPNDIYINDRKAGGILIENVMQGGNWKWSVVGIGINVNQQQFPEELTQATSLYMQTGQHYDSVGLGWQLCYDLEKRRQELLQGQWNDLLDQYNAVLFGRNLIKKLKRGNVVIPCMIRRVNNQGLLLAGENEEWRFEHGEVEWVF